MDEPRGQAFIDLAGLTANSPDTRGGIIAVIELEGGTRLVSGTLLDDCLRESLMAVDENLRSAGSILSSFYHVTTTENILPHVRQERHGSHHHTSWSTDRSFEHGPFPSGRPVRWIQTIPHVKLTCLRFPTRGRPGGPGSVTV